MSGWQKLRMAAFVQDADDVYATRDGLGIVCVKGDVRRVFTLDEVEMNRDCPDCNGAGRYLCCNGHVEECNNCLSTGRIA